MAYPRSGSWPAVRTVDTNKKQFTQAQWIADNNRSSGVRVGGYDTEDLKNPYRQDAWVHTALRMVQNAIMSVTLSFKTGKEDTDRELPEGHPLMRLFREVNPAQSPAEMQELIALYSNLYGEAILVFTGAGCQPMQTDGKGLKRRFTAMPEEVWVVPGGKRAELRFDPATGQPTHWAIQGATKTILIDYWATVPIGFPNPENHFRGMAPMEAAFGPAAQSYATHLFVKRSIERGSPPDGVLTFPEFLDDERFRTIESQINDSWNSNNSAGGTRVAHAGAKYESITGTAKDMQSAQFLDLSMKEIAGVFTVPEALMVSSAANFATFKGEWRRFWVLGIIPQLNRYVDRLSSQFIPRLPDRFGLPRVVPYYDMSEVEALQGDPGEQAESAGKLQKLGVPLDSALMTAGFEMDPIEGGDVPLIQGAWAPLADVAEGVDLEGGDGGTDEELEDNGDDEDDDDEEKAFHVVERAPDPTDNLTRESEEEGEPTEEDVDPPSTREERVDYWKMVEAEREEGDKSIKRGAQTWFNNLARIQMKHIRKIVKGGSKALDDIEERDLEICFSLSPATLVDFGRAMDTAEGQTSKVYDCCGTVIATDDGNTREAEARWLQHRPAVLRSYEDISDLRSAVYIQRAGVTAKQVTKLIGILARALAKPFGKSLFESYIRTFLDSVASQAEAEGLSGQEITVISKRMRKLMNGKAIKVSEGIQSRLAKRVRASYLKVLSGADGVGVKPFTQLLKQELGALEAVTTKEFRSASRRAIRIARTETASVDNRARWEQDKAWESDGLISGRTWLTAGGAPEPEGRIRTYHYDRDGTTRTTGETWSSTRGPDLRHPGDFNGSADEIIHCRCTTRSNRTEAQPEN